MSIHPATSAGILLLCSAVVSAHPITTVQQERLARALAFSYTPEGVVGADSSDQQHSGDDLSASALATFAETTMRADTHLVSRISPDLHPFFGVGTTSSEIAGAVGQGGGDNVLDVAFELSQTLAFDFGAEVELQFGTWLGTLKNAH
jgi:hypothetical protein